MHWGWLSPPTRRELSLVLFSLAIFIFAYNLDVTLSPHNPVFRKLGLASSSVIGKDGRRPSGWRDHLENVIFGDWPWDEGHVSGDGAERSMQKGSNRYGAQWLGKKATVVRGKVYGEDAASDTIYRWGDNVPTATLVQHAPGYTILDDLILFNGSIYLVTDHPTYFPPLPSIVSPRIGIDLKVLPSEQAASFLGTYGGKIVGVTFLSNDATPRNSTLISLWRTYSSIDPSIDAFGRTFLPPPRRLFFPQIPAFSDPRPNPDNLDFIRTRSPTGFHPYLSKTAFPGLGIMYREDWNDYHSMQVPFILERVVISDRNAAASSPGSAFIPPFQNLRASRYWMEPIRRTLLSYFNLEDEQTRKKVVTYLSTRGEVPEASFGRTEHKALTDALAKMGRRYGHEVNIITDATSWEEKMSAIVRSTVILGLHGTHLVDLVFMKPSPQPTVVELFPRGVFNEDNQILASAIGSRYMAWWNDRLYRGESLPPPHQSSNIGEVAVNVQVVVDAIRDSLQK